MGRIGLLCHGSNLHRFGIGSNGLGSTLKNAKFKGDNMLISTQVHSTQFDLSQFDLSYSTKKVNLILFDLFHSTHFMQSCPFDQKIQPIYSHPKEGCRELGQSQMGAYPVRSFSTISINLGVLFCESVLHLMRFSVFVYTGTITDTARRLCSLQRFGTISSLS